MKIDEGKVNILKQFISYISDYNVKVRENYSGRCMFGRKCFGIVSDENVVHYVMEFIGNLHDGAVNEAIDNCNSDEKYREDENNFQNFLSMFSTKMCIDNMGLSMIYYWPEIVTDGIEFESFDEEE